MTFAAANLTLIKSGVGGGPSLWQYTSADAHGTVSGTDYFAGMGSPATTSKGLKASDTVIVVDTNVPTTTIHQVTAIDADGNGTVNAATLA